MGNVILESLATVSPDYIIKQYGDVADKVIRFNRIRSSVVHYTGSEVKKPPKSYDEKLQESISRARSVIIQKALCNSWDWFITITLDKAKYDRSDVDKYHRDLSQWLRDRGKAYGTHIHFLLVPEMHKDGAWHMHGLISGIPSDRVELFKRGKHPKKLIDGGYMNWPDYGKKFGFCSLGRIRSRFKTAFYLITYISKSLNDMAGEKGKHLYYSSRGLSMARDSSYAYGHREDLDAFLTNHSEYCSTGWVTPVEWWWSMSVGDDIANCTEYKPFDDTEDNVRPLELSPDFGILENMAIEGFNL